MEKSGATETFSSSLENSGIDARKRARTQKWWSLSGKDVSYVSVDDDSVVDSETSSIDGVVKNINNVYEAPEATELYKPIEGFEGSHRFDPNATWTEAEEKTLVRKVCLTQCTDDHV
jgi:hypothetical protein